MPAGQTTGAPIARQRLRVEMVGVAVRREHGVREAEPLGRDDAAADPHVRRVRLRVLPGQRVGEVRVDEQVTAFVLDQEAALAEPPEVQPGSPRAASTSARNASSASCGSITAELCANDPHARDEVLQLLPRRPPRRLAEAAVGREGQSLGRSELDEPAHARGHVLGRLDVVALHVDHADGDVLRLGDRADELRLGELATRHLEMDLVDRDAEECGEERRVAAAARPRAPCSCRSRGGWRAARGRRRARPCG